MASGADLEVRADDGNVRATLASDNESTNERAFRTIFKNRTFHVLRQTTGAGLCEPHGARRLGGTHLPAAESLLKRLPRRSCPGLPVLDVARSKLVTMRTENRCCLHPVR